VAHYQPLSPPLRPTRQARFPPIHICRVALGSPVAARWRDSRSLHSTAGHALPLVASTSPIVRTAIGARSPNLTPCPPCVCYHATGWPLLPQHLASPHLDNHLQTTVMPTNSPFEASHPRRATKGHPACCARPPLEPATVLHACPHATAQLVPWVRACRRKVSCHLSHPPTPHALPRLHLRLATAAGCPLFLSLLTVAKPSHHSYFSVHRS
jgi:hypothetical protein